MSSTRRNIENLIEALDDVELSPEEVRDVVARIGIDIEAMAARIRAKIAAADERWAESEAAPRRCG